MKKEATLLIPAYNEEKNIKKTLENITQQELPDEFHLHVILLPNGCTDKTKAICESFVSESSSEKISWKTHSLDEGHKSKALNEGIGKTNTEVVFMMDADSKLDDNAVITGWEKLTKNEDLAVLGLAHKADFSALDKESYLYQCLLTLEIYRSHVGTALPIGRFIGFKKSKISEVPTNIAADDTWISLEAIRLYGMESVQLIKGPFVYYKPPTSWEDFIKQESRFIAGTNQLFNKYPKLKEIDEERVSKKRIEQETLIELLEKDLEKNDIPTEILYEIKDVIMRVIRENGMMNESGLISDAGTWEPILSTK